MSVGVDVALGLGVANLCVWLVVVVLLRRLWAQLKPQVMPMLSMLGMVPPE